MGKRFKSAMVVVVLVTVLLAVSGPFFALALEAHARTVVLVVWAAVFGTWILGSLSAIILQSHRRTNRLMQSLRRELAAKNNRDVIAEVRDNRVKQSRHEFKQELLLDRIDSTTTTLLGDIDSLRADKVVPEQSAIPWHGDTAEGQKILSSRAMAQGWGIFHGVSLSPLKLSDQAAVQQSSLCRPRMRS